MAAIVPTEALAAALDGSAVGGDEGAKMFVTMHDHVRALITRVASMPAVLMDAASIGRGAIHYSLFTISGALVSAGVATEPGRTRS